MKQIHSIPEKVTECIKRKCPMMFDLGHIEYVGKYKNARVYQFVIDEDGLFGLPQLFLYKKNLFGNYIVSLCREFPDDVLAAISSED